MISSKSKRKMNIIPLFYQIEHNYLIPKHTAPQVGAYGRSHKDSRNSILHSYCFNSYILCAKEACNSEKPNCYPVINKINKITHTSVSCKPFWKENKTYNWHFYIR